MRDRRPRDRGDHPESAPLSGGGRPRPRARPLRGDCGQRPRAHHSGPVPVGVRWRMVLAVCDGRLNLKRSVCVCLLKLWCAIVATRSTIVSMFLLFVDTKAHTTRNRTVRMRAPAPTETGPWKRLRSATDGAKLRSDGGSDRRRTIERRLRPATSERRRWRARLQGCAGGVAGQVDVEACGGVRLQFRDDPAPAALPRRRPSRAVEQSGARWLTRTPRRDGSDRRGLSRLRRHHARHEHRRRSGARSGLRLSALGADCRGTAEREAAHLARLRAGAGRRRRRRVRTPGDRRRRGRR